MPVTVRNPDIGALWYTLRDMCADINRETGGSMVVNPGTTTALDPTTSQTYMITKGSAAAYTLAAPAASPGGDGIRIELISTTAFAHTVTATGLLQTGTAAVNAALFAAFAGARLSLRSYNGKWVASGTGVTFS